MALFHVDALFTNDLLQQIINMDDVVLQCEIPFVNSAPLQGTNKQILALPLDMFLFAKHGSSCSFPIKDVF